MALTRKKYVLDKKFQLRISARAIILPLITTLAICSLLLYFSNRTNSVIGQNNKYIETIVDNQGTMIDMFLSTPALQSSDNPSIKSGVTTFKSNIGMLKNITTNSRIITRNSSIVFYILIAMTVVQTAIIFFQFIFFSHKISGPIHVMTNYLKEYRKGNCPSFRPLRKNDELLEFYDEFCQTLETLAKK
jgi:hypothetical protein